VRLENRRGGGSRAEFSYAFCCDAGSRVRPRERGRTPRSATIVQALALRRSWTDADTQPSIFTNDSSAAAVPISADNDPDFTDSFCAFLQRCVTSVDGAELLLALKSNDAQTFDARELIARLGPVTSLSEADVARHVAAFERCGVVERAGERVRYRAGPEEAHINALARLYLERPVTLFRVIYALRDTKIKTFADAFKVR
jgi:hypothetical protein